MKKISHSAMDKYLTCPKMYDIHYNERLRPTGTSSALVFGTAMDEALNNLLLTRKLQPSIDIFRDNLKWEDMQEVNFDARDMDNSIVERDSSDTDSLFAWKCLRVKGRMLLEAYNEKILPEIEEVESVQEELCHRPGVIDAIVKLRGHGRVLLDNKTSVRPYADSSVADSTQLHLYAAEKGIKKIGFAVLIKTIQKNTKRICKVCGFNGSYVRHRTCPQTVNGNRCRGAWDESFSPEARVQLLVGEVREATKKLVTDTITQVERGIEAEVYPRNLRACGKIYGKPCVYVDYCWKNKRDGLITKEKKDGK